MLYPAELLALIYFTSGAGDGNRTHATSLEGWSSTIELHLRLADHTRFELVISSVTGKHVGPLHQWSRSLLALEYYREYCSFLQAKNEKSRQDASLYIIYKDKSPFFAS